MPMVAEKSNSRNIMTRVLGTEVKICGLSDEASIEAAVGGGADYIGFIFFQKSPRNIDPKRAGELSRTFAGAIKKVAVSVNADDENLDNIVEQVKPDVLQLHGSETPERVNNIRMRYELPVMKAFAIRQYSDFEQTDPYIGVADRFLFDAKPPANSELPGGNGVSFDWNLFDQWQQKRREADNSQDQDNSLDFSTLPMLSGGINPENIHTALANSKAQAVDISSGVEKAPGVKDPRLIRQFLDHIRVFEKQ